MPLLQLVADADADVVGMSVCAIGVKCEVGLGSEVQFLTTDWKTPQLARGVVDVRGRGLSGVH